MDTDELIKILRSSTEGVYRWVGEDPRGPQGIILDTMRELGHEPGRWEWGPKDGMWSSSVIRCKHCNAWAMQGNAIHHVDVGGKKRRHMATWGPALQLRCDWLCSVLNLLARHIDEFMAKQAPVRWVA